MLKVFWICIFIQALPLVQSCSRRRRPAPQPCSWRTCYHDWRDAYSPSVPQGKCVYQSRASTHLYKTNHGTAPCPASTSCDWRTQSRTRCSCREVQTCSLQSWSSWSGHVPTNKCARQSRYRGWNEYYVRYRMEDKCDGIRSSCGNGENDYRTRCSCQYVRCETLPWTSWTEIETRPGHCITIARYQRQRKTILYKTQTNNCNGVQPQTCPGDVQQVQEKVVHCPALPNPAVGRWDKPQCSQGQQRCNSLCTLECTGGLKGYTRTGNNPTRTCLSSGVWSSSTAYCKDEEAPEITCPSPATFGTDVGKKYKTVTLPEPARAVDNSGKRPTVTTSVGKAQHVFQIAPHAHEVVYTARDEAGHSRQCTWYVTIKDMEKPKVLECPADIAIVTTKDKERVSWDDPRFQDNYDSQPRITSDKHSGSFFYFGKTKVTYTASDSAGNKATCQFNVIVSVLHCPVFNAPRNGAHTCNVKVDEKYEHHLYCNIQCQQDYAFISNDVYDIYQCTAGVWSGINNFPPKIYKYSDKSVRPWVDCTEEDNAEGVKKVINAYVGTCNENDPASLEQIKQNFIAALNDFIISKMVFCGKNEANCDISNVKVYCGKSKRSGDVSRQVVSVEIVIRDKKPVNSKAKALQQHEMMKLDLDATELAADKKIVAKMGISGMHLEAYQSELSCKAGEILKVRQGEGDELARSTCVKCAEGTFFNDEEECIACPEGTYQDGEGETSCIHCPEGTWTLGNQATNQTDCVDVCGPGEYSQLGNGLANCIACPLGTYQPNFKQSNCMRCPSGKTTKLCGAASEDDCQ